MSILIIFSVWSFLLLIPIYLYANMKYKSEYMVNLVEPLYLFGVIFWLSYGVNFFAVSNGIGIFGWSYKYLYFPIEMEVLGISLFFFYSFMIGYYLSTRYISFEFKQQPVQNSSFLYNNFATVVLYGFVAITIYKIYFLFEAKQHFGSFEYFRGHFVEYSTGNGVATLFSSSFIEYFVVLGIVLLFSTKNKFHFTLLVFLLLINAFIFYYFQTSRRVVLYIVVGLAFYFYERKHIGNKKLVFLGIMTVVLIILFLHLRASLGVSLPQLSVVNLPQLPTSIATQQSQATLGSALFYYLGLLTVSFDMFIHTVSVFAKFPLQENWLGIVNPLNFFYDQVISFIPRSIYGAKPLIYGDFYLQNLVYPEIYAREGINAGRFPLGVVSASYLYFGLIGIGVVGGLIGLFYDLLYRVRYKHIIYSFVFMYFYITMFNVVRGGVGTIINQGVQMSFFLLLLLSINIIYSIIRKK